MVYFELFVSRNDAQTMIFTMVTNTVQADFTFGLKNKISFTFTRLVDAFILT